MTRFLIAILTVCCVSPAAFAALQPALDVYDSWFRPATSAAYLYVTNGGTKPVSLSKLSIDDAFENATVWPVDKNRKADWFDMLPASLAPGQIGQIRVHLHEPFNNPSVKLTVEMSDGSQAIATIAATASPIFFDDITFGKDGSDAAMFVHTDATIAKVLVDGEDVTTKCDMKSAAPFHGVSAIYYHPASPLIRGSYHNWEARTADDHRAIYTARTLSNNYIIGTYGKPDFEPYKSHAINHYISFGNVPPAKFQELASMGMSGSFVPFIGGAIDGKTKEYKPLDTATTTQRIDGVKGNPNVAYYSAPDEPDGSDYPLGIGVHGRSIVAMREFATQLDPATPCFVQVDNTYRNQNYRVYCETMDYSASHRYSLGEDDYIPVTHDGIQQLRDATAPLPYLWVTQLYPIRQKVGEHAKYDGRDPLPAEMHIQMLQALGGGAKGFIHYIHSGSSAGGRGGSGTVTSLWDAMGPMHQQVAAVGAVAVRSSPVAWATASDSHVHVDTLLCDPSNLLVVLTNDAIQSTKADCTVPEITNVKIKVELPAGRSVKELVEVVPGGGLNKIEFQKSDSGIELTLPKMREGTILWLKGESQ